MKKVLLSLAILGMLSTGLQAADLTNNDSQVHEVTAIYGTGVYGGNEAPVPVKFLMLPGFTYKFVCSSCTLTLNGSSILTTDTDVITIQGGKLVKAE